MRSDIKSNVRRGGTCWCLQSAQRCLSSEPSSSAGLSTGHSPCRWRERSLLSLSPTLPPPPLPPLQSLLRGVSALQGAQLGPRLLQFHGQLLPLSPYLLQLLSLLSRREGECGGGTKGKKKGGIREEGRERGWLLFKMIEAATDTHLPVHILQFIFCFDHSQQSLPQLLWGEGVGSGSLGELRWLS